MSDTITVTNPFLRIVREAKAQVAERLLAGPPAGKNADQLGLLFADYSGRHRVLVELEAQFLEILSKGETIDED